MTSRRAGAATSPADQDKAVQAAVATALLQEAVRDIRHDINNLTTATTGLSKSVGDKVDSLRAGQEELKVQVATLRLEFDGKLQASEARSMPRDAIRTLLAQAVLALTLAGAAVNLVMKLALK